jgi:hypothetical protein
MTAARTLAAVIAMSAAVAASAGEPDVRPDNFTLADGSTALDYLAQSVCLGADGKPTDRLPIDADCTTRRPMTEDDPVRWRKHDWGDTARPSGGWQASDAVLAHRGNVAFVDQTFDFGAPASDNSGRPDAFLRFDANDGGDAIRIVGDTASAFLTQDGGRPGLQWFVGPGCAQPGPGRYVSWILFKADADAAWRSVVAELGDDPEDRCPARFNHAFTRYRLVTTAFPLRRPGAMQSNVTLPAILSEHFDALSIDRAQAMERFYYARHLGKVRWEAWSADAGKTSQAEALARSGRCAELPDGAPPATGWLMVDCRMWTNIVADPAPPNWRVRDFGWPPADLTLQ